MPPTALFNREEHWTGRKGDSRWLLRAALCRMWQWGWFFGLCFENKYDARGLIHHLLWTKWAKTKWSKRKIEINVAWVTLTSVDMAIQLAIRWHKYFLWHSKVLSRHIKLIFSNKPLKTKFISLWSSFFGFLPMPAFKSKAEDSKWNSLSSLHWWTK